ncbi:MAG: DNA polymerase, partial [Bdellovibrionales bacterium]
PLVATGKLNIESLQAELTEQASQVRETSHWSLEELKKNIAPYESVWAVQTERGFCLGYKGKPIQVDASLIEIGKVLSSKKLKWNGFDLKAIWHSLKIENATTPEWDSQLAAYVIKAGDISSFSETYSKYTNKKIADLATVEDFLFYQIELADILNERLKEVGGYSVLEKLDLPVVPILYSMESRGIKINAEELKAQSLTLNVDIEALEKQIHSLAGESFNISSPKQLGAILFEKLKIPSVKKTKTGFSTGSEVLSKLAPEFPICELVMNYRELTKLKSTYVDAIPQLIDSTDGRIHTRFHQTVTLTGRLSSTNPNLQNIPVRTERGRMIRKAFVAPEGSVLLSVDYSQIELRILAEITGDPGLTKAFLDDVDIHSATAAEVFGIPLEQVNADQRRMAKAVNFGIAYGQGVFGLAETLDIPQNEAKTIIENYFQKFPKVKEYMFDIVNSAKEHGYVETKLGRKRYMDEFKSSNAMIRKFGERAAINSPIQGTASDLMKLAMIEVYQNCSAKMLLQVHDELLFECFEDQVESDAEEISKVMTSVANFKIPLKVNVAWGKNWEDAHA